MTTTTLSFKQRFFQLYRSTLKSNLGLLFLYTALTLIMAPLLSGIDMLSSSGGTTSSGFPIAPHRMNGAANVYGYSTAMYLSFYVLIAPLITVCTVCRPLHNRRAADMYNALPISRRGLLGAWTAAGFTIMAVPLLLAYLLFPLAAAVVRYPLPIHPLLMAWDFFLLLLTMFTAMGIVTICVVCTGTTFDSVIFSVLTALLPISVWFVLDRIVVEFANGLGARTFHIGGDELFLFIPGTAMSQHLFWIEMNWDDGICTNVPYILLWLLIGCVLYALAFYFVRRRKGEMSGTLNRLPVLEYLICGTVTLVGGLFFGWILTNSVYIKVEKYKWLAQILFSAITGALVFAVVETILRRGLHGMKKWFLRTGAVFGAMAAVTGGAILYIETVVEDYRPDPSQVETITVVRDCTLYYGLTDAMKASMAENYQLWLEGYESRWNMREIPLTVRSEENIQRLSGIHRQIIEEYNQRSWEWWQNDNSKPKAELNFTYHLKNGKEVSRQYYTYDTAVIDEILRLYGQEETLCQSIPLLNPDYGERWGRLAVQDSLQLREKEYPTLGQDSAKFRRLIDTLRSEFAATGTETFFRETETPIAWIFYSDPKAAERAPDDLSFFSGIVPVYESFTQTVGLLKEYGYGEMLEPDLSNVKRAVITNGSALLNVTAFNQRYFIEYQKEPETMKSVFSRIASDLAEYSDNWPPEELPDDGERDGKYLKTFCKELTLKELEELLPQVRISIDKPLTWQDESRRKMLIICTDDRYIVRYLEDEF